MTNYPNIDRLLGIHERLQILYVVDGYEVDFSTDDGDTWVLREYGETVAKALSHLDKRLQPFSRAYIKTLRRLIEIAGDNDE